MPHAKRGFKSIGNTFERMDKLLIDLSSKVTAICQILAERDPRFAQDFARIAEDARHDPKIADELRATRVLFRDFLDDLHSSDELEL